MLSQQDIQDALETHLVAFPLTIDVAWELYEPKDGVAYLKPVLSSCLRRTVGAGIRGAVQYDGTYTINVRRPADEGRQAAGQIAGALVAHFGRDQVVTTQGGVAVILMDATEQPGATTGNWISLPVVVTFAASE